MRSPHDRPDQGRRGNVRHGTVAAPGGGRIGTGSSCCPLKSTLARWRLRHAILYVVLAAIGHLFWESAQLPLYTVWWKGTLHENFVAVVHCSGGDVLITTSTFLIAALIARRLRWHPLGSRMILAAIALGVGYTILSEWLNIEIWRSWSYSSAMPILPWFGTGLSPFLQWLVVPGFAFAISGLTVRAAP